MKKVLLADLDGTLTKSSAILMFIGYLIDNEVIADTELRQQWENDMKNEHLIVEYAEHFKRQLIGKEVTYIEHLAEEFLKQDTLEFYDSSMKILNKCKNDGYACFIISGSCDFLVQVIARKFGIFGFGSIYETDKNGMFTGKISLPMFIADEKKKIIDKLLFPQYIEYVVGLGDTISDRAIALASDEFFLVDPTAETMKVYNELDIEYTILM